MFTFILENIATIVVGILLLAVVSLIIVRMVRNKKKGNSSCGCGCVNCPMSGECHKKK